MSEDINKKLVIYGGGFNPPGNHHRKIAEALLEVFAGLIIMPCGAYSYKDSIKLVTNGDREMLVRLGFEGLPRTEFDLTDLASGKFSPIWAVDQRYKQNFSDTAIWHAIGGDLVAGGRVGRSQIQQLWINGSQVWEEVCFAVINHPGCFVDEKDLPPKSCLINLDELYGRSTFVRKRIQEGLPVADLVPPKVAAYIAEKQLYV